MKIMVRNVIPLLLAAVLTLSLWGCAGTGTQTTSPGESTGTINVGPVNEGLTGTINVSCTADYTDVYQKIIAAFRQKYPNVTVTFTETGSSMYGQITTMTGLAAAGKLPDVCVGSEQFGYIVQQGWAYPLDNLLAADPDKSAIIGKGLENFTYNGHTYGMPYQIQFDTIGVNLELIDMLNMDAPDYDWTIDEFVSMAKKATTSQYSGINYVYNTGNPTWGLDNKLMNGMLPEGYQQYGYSFETHNIDLTVNDAWVRSNQILAELSGIHGLVSDDLKSTGTGSVSDYEKKFGEGADALLSGKVLFGNHSTWEYGLYNRGGFEFDLYPVPTDEGIGKRIMTHFDFIYMTTNVTEENRDAAYAFMKFVSCEEGCLIRLADNLQELADMPESYGIYIPASNHPDVVKAFNESGLVDGVKYMYNTILTEPETIMVADCDKLIPNFWNDIGQFRDSATQSIQDGADPAALINDLQSKASYAIGETWKYFESCLSKNLDKFYQTHPWEAPEA